ncbi:MAG: hypothetical protein KDA16_06855 [Phycisphaerales bacterium]|nr:hypothetical protein [Phycisphaerales bacterium]
MTSWTRAWALRGTALLFLAGCGSNTFVWANEPDSDRFPVQGPSTTVERHPGDPLFGISTFPYDFTQAALDKTMELATDKSQVFTVQRDDGIPWREALANSPMPASVMQKWASFKNEHPDGMPLYLAIAPLDFDRKNLAGAVEGSSVPSSIQGAAFDSNAVKTAYLNYVRAAVDYFHPAYINIGVEAGELAHRNPSKWPAFERLIVHVTENIKQEQPDLMVGISWGLQSLTEPDVAERSRSLIDRLDFVGISFYPYMSNFHEKFGCTPLPAPPQEWRGPLNWLREYTNKPIAICETGYNSKDESLPAYSISLKGSEQNQVEFIKDLARIARRDDYLFVVWYFGVDITRLLAQLPDGGSQAKLWRENGLFDKDLNPKPAWNTWNEVLAGQYTADEILQPAGSESSAEAALTTVTRVGFSANSDLFQTDTNNTVRLVDDPSGSQAMRWEFRYRYGSNDWKWASRRIDRGSAAQATKMRFRVKATSGGGIVVQLKEGNGESFFQAIQPTDNWQTVTIDLDSMSVDQSTRKDGELQAGKIVEIVLADGGAAQGASGERTIWFADWEFVK